MCDDSSGVGDSEEVISCIIMTMMNVEKGDKRKEKRPMRLMALH